MSLCRYPSLVSAPTLNPADVLVSLEDGWHYGSPLFDRLVEIRGTHGSARASSSVGFLASNVDPTPARIAAHDAFPWLGLGTARPGGGASETRPSAGP